MIPSLLYSIDAPVGEVITIVPVGIEQVGCVTVASGTGGASGTGWITKFAVDIQVGSVAVLRTLIV